MWYEVFIVQFNLQQVTRAKSNIFIISSRSLNILSYDTIRYEPRTLHYPHSFIILLHAINT